MPPRHNAIRTHATKRGVRILQHGTVLSEVLSRPGPTHSVVDVMAASLQVLSSGPEMAMLGFSGGGLIGPLRAMGSDHRVTALDMDDHGFETFESLCRGWAGSVQLHKAEAANWLRKCLRRFDHIIVDLSVGHGGDVEIPNLVWEELPNLIAARLQPHGTAIFNLLRPLNMTWGDGLSRVSEPFHDGMIISFREYQNRILLVGNIPRTARALSDLLRLTLHEIGSKQAGQISVRQLKREEKTFPFMV